MNLLNFWVVRTCQSGVKIRALCEPSTHLLLSLLGLCQAKLTECTWPFTYSFFSLILHHSSSSSVHFRPVCGLCLTTCRLECSISQLAHNSCTPVFMKWLNCVFLRTPELIMLIFRPVRGLLTFVDFIPLSSSNIQPFKLAPVVLLISSVQHTFSHTKRKKMFLLYSMSSSLFRI